MNNDESKKSALEGEGSYTGTRNYNRHLAEATANGDVEAAAEEARRAVEGPEGEELARAAEEAKKGPRQPGATTGKAGK